jgi:hypothetical protein
MLILRLENAASLPRRPFFGLGEHSTQLPQDLIVVIVHLLELII